ncbi:MAG: ComF family protein [Oscillospiraceae bacterium]
MNILNEILLLIFPQKCIYCGKIVSKTVYSCNECNEELPLIKGEICQKCGAQIQRCSCDNKKVLFVRNIAPAYYEDAMKKAIKQFKFKGCKHFAVPFAKLMAKTFEKEYSDIKFDYITAVPMYPKRERTRGYNQAVLLAKELSDITGIALKSDLLTKYRDNNVQHRLDAKERADNVKDVYSANKKALNKTILLVDDICTTSSTLNACTAELLKQGAKQVYCITIAIVINSK